MQRVVITGSWRLRVGEPEVGVELNVCPVDAPIDFDRPMTLVDLRPYGLNNLAHRDVPLALAYFDGDTLYLKALLMRQEMHVCHFYSPMTLPSCNKDRVSDVLAEAFQKWHLTLNNFECCFFEAPPGMAFACHFEIDLPASHAADMVIEHLDTLQWPQFYLHLGSELSSIRSRKAVYRCPSSSEWLTVERGCRRKKSINSTGLRIEVFSHAGNGWVRSDVIESLNDDVDKELLQFRGDSDPDKLFKHSHDLYVSGSRVGVESAISGGIYELDFCFFQSAGAQQSNSREECTARSVVIRYVGGRKPFDMDCVQSDMSALSSCLVNTLDLDSSTRELSELPSWAWNHFDIA
uniref:Uncharacterized protein n=1 Tax=Pseudomonas syringae pv. actinidiae TaxID=103796 RepID=A0A7D5HI18_PSESF|nr:hypothetical protein [Pseudomonas syringae pv. actinidiae]QKZ25997.1 hypothetical protein [Pseudomonas syringae pv. actinidiae]QKZ26019.1 hypothetical protein [Pseudomonas syringae pv. actinidiae]